MSIKKYWLYEESKIEKDSEPEVDSKEESDLEDYSDEDLEDEDSEDESMEDSDAELSLDDEPEDDLEDSDLDLDADDSEDGDDLDMSLDDESDLEDEEPDGEEFFEDSETEEEVEVENLQDDEEEIELDDFDSEGRLARDSELDFNDDSGGTGFDDWLEDAGVTGEVSDFENFDELPENEDLESDSGNDEFGVEVRTAFAGREKVGPDSVDEAVASGRTVEYDKHELWVAAARRNGYRIKPHGGSARTLDQIWVAYYKDGSEVGRFSQENSSGKLSFVISEGRDVLRLFEQEETQKPLQTKPSQDKQKTQKKVGPVSPKKKYAFDSEDKVPQNAKWLQIKPSKIGASDVDDAAQKVAQAGIPVIFAMSAYGKAKIAYAGTTLRQKVNDALVKLGLGEDEASGIAGGRTELEDDPQQADGTREGMKAALGSGPGQDEQESQGPDDGSEDLASQVDDDPNYQPQRQDHPEDEPDEDTLHIAVKGTDEVVASLKDAGIKVKSFGNHQDGDYVRVDAMDAAKAHEWMLSHGWDENEAQHAVGTAKSKASLAPIKKAMQDVLGDEAPDISSHEDFKKWLQGAHGKGEDKGEKPESEEISEDEWDQDMENLGSLDGKQFTKKLKELKKKI